MRACTLTRVILSLIHTFFFDLLYAGVNVPLNVCTQEIPWF